MTTGDQGSDPLVGEMRMEISAVDREILEAVNRRLELVAQLHAYKAERGYPIVDRAREEAVLTTLASANPGPLSPGGVRELFEVVIAVVTREAAAQRAGHPMSPRRSPPG